MNRIIRNTMTDVNSGGTPHLRRRLAKLAGAAVAGLRRWAESLPPGPGFCAEALEERRLFTFDLTVAGPPSATAGTQFWIYAWTSGETMSGNYSVDFGDGTGSHAYAPSTTSRVTAIPYTYSSGGDYPIDVTANSCTQSLGLEDVGNFPAGNGGPTAYMPGGATSSSAADVVYDLGTTDTYVAESYHTSSGGYQMALTRLNASDLPDTTFGTLVSGTTHTGTYVVSSFGGGSDIPYAAAALDTDTVDYIALAGHSANGMAVAIVDVSGAGSTVATSDYGSQTMPSGTACAVTVDSSHDVVAAGTNSTTTAFVAVALYGVTSGGDYAGELDSSFGTGGSTSCDIGGSGNGAAALAITQEQSTGAGNSDLVLGGWMSPGCTGCSSCGLCTYSCCFMTVLGLHDNPLDPSHRGQLDQSGFGAYNSGTGLYSGYCTIEVSGSGTYNTCSGTGTPSNDSVYSLAWEDEGDYIMAIGGTNYSGANQFALWALNDSGYTDTGFGPDGTGLSVPNVNATAAGGTADNWEGNGSGSAPDGYFWLVGTRNNDMFIGRTDGSGVLDTSFGTYNSTTNQDQGYFTQDLGTASANSSDTGHAIAVEGDGSVVIVGNTSGGNIAVARYLELNTINVASVSEGIAYPSLAAVQAASQPPAAFSSGPSIAPDSAANDLPPPDDTGTPDALRRHRLFVSRSAVTPAASPTISSAPRASGTSL